MKDDTKPAILIALKEQIPDEVIEEITAGIEEEGCLYSEYTMDGEKDIRYSNADVCIVVGKEHARIHLKDLGSNSILPSANIDAKRELRTLGSNAARYLKGLRLKMLR